MGCWDPGASEIPDFFVCQDPVRVQNLPVCQVVGGTLPESAKYQVVLHLNLASTSGVVPACQVPARSGRHFYAEHAPAEIIRRLNLGVSFPLLLDP